MQFLVKNGTCLAMIWLFVSMPSSAQRPTPPDTPRDLYRRPSTPWQALQNTQSQQIASPRFESNGFSLMSPEVSQLSARIHNETDGEARKKLSEELRTKMEQIFDADLANRAQELKRLDARLKALKSSVQKRRNARDRIIDHRIESILLQAEGLGLPGEARGPAIPWPPAAYGSQPVWQPVPQGQAVRASTSPEPAIRPLREGRVSPVQPKTRVLHVYKDGRKEVQYTITKMQAEARRRVIPVTEPFDGNSSSDRKQVPKTTYREQTYTVRVPVAHTSTVIVKKGQSIQDAINIAERSKQARQDGRFTDAARARNVRSFAGLDAEHPDLDESRDVASAPGDFGAPGDDRFGETDGLLDSVPSRRDEGDLFNSDSAAPEANDGLFENESSSDDELFDSDSNAEDDGSDDLFG